LRGGLAFSVVVKSDEFDGLAILDQELHLEVVEPFSDVPS